MMTFTFLVENSLLIRELVITAFLMLVLMSVKSNFYENIIESTSDIYKCLDDSIDCYAIYDAATDKKGEHYRLPLVGAAINVVLVMFAFAVLIWAGTDFIASLAAPLGTTTAIDALAPLFRLTGISLGVFILVSFSCWVFYSFCKSYASFNSEIKEKVDNESAR